MLMCSYVFDVSATACQRSSFILCCSNYIGPKGVILKTHTHRLAAKVLLETEIKSYPVFILLHTLYVPVDRLMGCGIIF